MFDPITWGVAAGFIFKPIIEELAKDATKDWVKDMFKSSLSNVVKLSEKEPLEKAAKKALGKFLEEFKEQLQDADLDDKTVREYIQPLKKFLGIKQVTEGLGSAFFEVQGIDTTILSKIWQTYNLKELPNDFETFKI